MKDYLQAFKRYTKGIRGGIATGSWWDCPRCPDKLKDEPDEEYSERTNEPSFGHLPCDTCGTHLGGYRSVAHGWPEDKPIQECSAGDVYHLSICVDCRMFIANGELPTEWSGA